ncbi:MAG: hypothetical protein EOO24_33810, partial [Comamonadaceae bacterium]
RERLPGVSLHLNEELTGNLLDHLRQGRVDLAIFTPIAGQPEVVFQPFVEEEFYLLHATDAPAELAQVVEQVAGEFLVQVQRHARQPLAGRADQRQRQRGRHALRQAQHHRADDGLRRRAHGRLHVAQLLEDGLRVRVEGLAGLGDRHARAAAVEQLHAQLFLQLGDLLAQRRLRDEHLQRGARQAAAVGHRQEVLELSQFQKMRLHTRAGRARQSAH